MKGKIRKRIFALAVTVLVIASMIPAAAFAGVSSVQMGTGNIQPGDKVYYGHGERIWQVLSLTGIRGLYHNYDGDTTTDDKALLLLSSEGMIRRVLFNVGGNTDYKESEIRRILVDAASYACQDYFSGIEKTAILRTYIPEVEDITIGGIVYTNPGLPTDKLFLLSAAEINTYLPSREDRIMQGEGGFWWLRSAYRYGNSCAVIKPDGTFIQASPGDSKYGSYYYWARPAFHLDKDYISFISSPDIKAVNDADGGLAAVPADAECSVWKLTVKDNKGTYRENFNVKVASRTNESIFVRYGSAQTGNNEYISALIQDEDGNVKYYGRIKNLPSIDDRMGAAEIVLTGIQLGSGDKLYVFNEQYNAGNKTDYCSRMIEVDISQSVNAYDVNTELSNLEFTGKGYTLHDTNTSNYTGMLKAADGYTLPQSIKISIGDKILVPGEQNDYTYNKSTGEIVIKAGLIKDDVKIEASAEPATGIGMPGVSGGSENDPDNYNESEAVTGNDNDAENGGPVQTGDSSNMAIWFAVMLAAGTVLTGTVIYSRKRRYNR